MVSRDITVRDWVREKGCRLKTARNRTGSVFRPNNDYRKRSCAKIIKGALPGGPRYYRVRLSARKRLPSQNRAKSHR